MANPNMSPIEMARNLAAQKGGQGGSVDFFKLGEGETKTIRFLTALVPMYQISHEACGANHIDIKAYDFDEAEKNGQPFACPNCGQPLTRENIIYTRPEVLSFENHGFVQGADGKRRSYLCLGSEMNAAFDLVENINGQPKYDCPICKATEKHPSTRCYGIAVERKVITEMKRNEQGLEAPVVTGIEDVIFTDDDGVTRPRVVVVDMPYARFWSQLMNFSEDFSRSIAYYDWTVSRIGTSTQTQYIVQCANEAAPSGLDMDLYKDYMPNLKSFLQAMGSPKRFVENGWFVEGYTPAPTEQNQATGVEAAQQVFQQATQPAAQPQMTQPAQQQATPQAQAPMQPTMPAAQNNWGDIQAQLGQQ